MLMRCLLESTLGWGLVAKGANEVTKRENFQLPSLTILGGKKGWR